MRSTGSRRYEANTSFEFPGGLEIVQPPSGQLRSMPEVLALTTFSNLVEIFNRVKSAQERLFYIVYAHRERLKTLELRKCIVDDAYASLLGGGKQDFSKALKTIYPDAPVMFGDAAFVDFLNLPEFYLEALDRDVRRQNENPSIGILLCKNADRSVVEYAMSRTMSPAMVAEYKRVMIPKEVLQETFETYLALPAPSRNGAYKQTNRNLLK